MENGMKLSEILYYYSNPMDQRVIGDFWRNLQDYEAVLL